MSARGVLGALLMVLATATGCSDDNGGGQDLGAPDSAATEDTAQLCQDGQDNDGDQAVDCADPDCSRFAFCGQDGGPASEVGTPDGLQPDGGPAPDAQPDAGQLEPLPDCPSGCGTDEVCWGKACVPTGPTKNCGSSKFGSGLPSTGVVYVDASHAGTSTGTMAQPFKTIAAALGAASPTSNVIAVATGTYKEDLNITESVEIRCRCATQVTIEGKLAVPSTGVASDLVVVIDGCSITPPGFAGARGTCSGNGDPKGIAVGNVNHTVSLLVRDSIVAGWCSGIAFSLNRNLPVPSTAPLPLLCVTRSNLLANVRGLDLKEAPPPYGKGWPDGECQGVAQTVAAERSRVSTNESGVIAAGGARDVALRGNLIRDNGQGLAQPTGFLGIGIYLGNAVSAVVESNRIEDNANRGVGIANLTSVPGTSVQIGKNAVARNAGAGIQIQQLQAQQPVQVTNNLIKDTKVLAGVPGGDGIQVTKNAGVPYDVSIQGNTIEGSARHGVILDGIGGAVSGNTISGSGQYGVVLQQSSATASSNTYQSNTAGNLVSHTTAVDQCGTLPDPLP
jgi:hypothetical protein